MTPLRIDPQAVTILGHWQGELGHPHRFFSGRITSSTHPRIEEGEVVVVTYHCPEGRVVPCHEHGAYLLKLRRNLFALRSFLCEGVVHPGRPCREPGSAYWFAQVIPERRPMPGVGAAQGPGLG